MEKDYKDTAFRASQMLLQFASFLRNNKNIEIGLKEKDAAEMAHELMADVRELYKNN